MTLFELSRYLDYCSEALSLTGKVAALYVQPFDDPVALDAVSEVEQLTTGLSRKIWQKLTVLFSMPPVEPAPAAAAQPWALRRRRPRRPRAKGGVGFTVPVTSRVMSTSPQTMLAARPWLSHCKRSCAAPRLRRASRAAPRSIRSEPKSTFGSPGFSSPLDLVDQHVEHELANLPLERAPS